MKYWNSGKGEPNLLQKRFSGYLKTAVLRKKTDLFRTRNKVYGHEYFNDAWGNIPGVIVEDTYFNFPTQFDTTGLERAFQRIEPRDRYIFFAHVLDERTFTELAAELGIGYKGVAAAYYRTIHKIRNVLRGDAHGF